MGKPRKGSFSLALGWFLLSTIGECSEILELRRHEEGAGQEFGTSVANGADLNGDDGDEFLVADNAVIGQGPVAAFSEDGTYLFTKVYPRSVIQDVFSNFGACLEGLPDYNEDGFGDFAVGAPGSIYGGSVLIYSGSEAYSSFPSPNMRTTQQGQFFPGRFGSSLTGTPDVNGDGMEDLLVGASGEDRAYLFSGSGFPLLRTLAPPEGEEVGGFGGFGASCAGVPDTDGDGRGDVVVGSWWATAEGSPEATGRAYVYSGSTGALLHNLGSPNEEINGTFGSSLSAINDVDGDKCGEVIVGAERESPDSLYPTSGAAYLFSGSTGELLHEFHSTRPISEGYFGHVVEGITDVDYDGREDVAVGAPLESADNGVERAGRVYIYSGGSGRLLWTFVSPHVEEGGRFGFSVSKMTPTPEGFSRVIVGAPAEDPGTSPTDAGRVYVITFSLSSGIQAWRQYQ